MKSSSKGITSKGLLYYLNSPSVDSRFCISSIRVPKRLSFLNKSLIVSATFMLEYLTIISGLIDYFIMSKSKRAFFMIKLGYKVVYA